MKMHLSLPSDCAIVNSEHDVLTGTIAPLCSIFQPARYLSEASQLLGIVAYHCCLNRFWNQSLTTYQPMTAYTEHIRKRSNKTFSSKTFENVQKRFSILHAFVSRPYTNLVKKMIFENVWTCHILIQIPEFITTGIQQKRHTAIIVRHNHTLTGTIGARNGYICLRQWLINVRTWQGRRHGRALDDSW